MALKPYLGKEVITKIAEYYLADKDAPAKEIQERVNSWLKDVKHSNREVSLSTVQRELAKYHKKEKEKEGEPNPIDQPWTIGACATPEYNIPADMIPVLIKEQELRMKCNLGPGNLTIREALWFARLYPVLSQIAQKLFPGDNPLIWHGMVSIASRQYAYKEQVGELMSEQYFDTKDLDYWFFIKEDISIWHSLRDWADISLKEKRDMRYVEQESEPKRIEAFTVYQEKYKKGGKGT